MKSLSNNAESFTPIATKIETLADGRTIQVAVKGVPIPIAEAKRLGLIIEPEAEKAKAPAANKVKTPTENK